MRIRAAQLAACAIAIAAAVTGCRRQPPAARTPDGAADMIVGRSDAGATADGRLDAALDTARDAQEAEKAEEAADTGAGETNATDAAVETTGDDARADLPGEIHPDGASADAPADTPSTDGTTSDVRPEDQPCGTLGFPCRPYACDVARGICKSVCQTDDDCSAGIHCTATSSCGFREEPTCSANAECQSGHCAQGVCCATACSQRCYSCASTGSLGTCAPVSAGAPDPMGTCPAGTACDGRGACVPPTCAADGDCGSLHVCTNAHCVPCSPTCITSSDCDVGAVCFNRNGCTSCGIADAGAGP